MKGVNIEHDYKSDKNKARLKRHLRVRKKIKGTTARPRLNVFRSSKHMYAQIIDDVNRCNNRMPHLQWIKN